MPKFKPGDWIVTYSDGCSGITEGVPYRVEENDYDDESLVFFYADHPDSLRRRASCRYQLYVPSSATKAGAEEYDKLMEEAELWASIQKNSAS